MKKRNVYTHDIDLKKLEIKNAPSKEFAMATEKIPYRGYEVENISDGRKIVIAKPGGKQVYGRMMKEDFFVFVFNPQEKTLWQITHDQIYNDLLEKSKIDRNQTKTLLEAFERVYLGEEPDDILIDLKVNIDSGEIPEVLLKAYKWIWGQEDVNYPTGKGRAMSWEGWEKRNKEMVRTGKGLLDLLINLQRA
ncbi:MAG: hypothetical protein FJ128_08755 [Deltaproteobacteria bacterium]|nr:hypothetical protein [Deltaproteobacteria bacterium]